MKNIKIILRSWLKGALIGGGISFSILLISYFYTNFFYKAPQGAWFNITPFEGMQGILSIPFGLLASEPIIFIVEQITNTQYFYLFMGTTALSHVLASLLAFLNCIILGSIIGAIYGKFKKKSSKDNREEDVFGKYVLRIFLVVVAFLIGIWIYSGVGITF